MRGVVAILVVLLLVAQAYAIVDFYITGVEPQKLKPGEKTVLNLTIKNFGSDFATNFRVILDPEGKSYIKPIGAQKVFVSRSVAEGKPSKYFGAVIQNQEVKISIPIAVSRDAEFGYYLIPIKLLYRDPEQVDREEVLYFGVEIAGEADISIGGINTSPKRIYPDEDFDLFITLENTGTDKAEKLKMELELPRGIEGERVNYLGTLNRDSRAIAVFKLKSSKNVKPGNLLFKARLTYYERGVKKEIVEPFYLFISEKGEVEIEIAGLDTSPKKLIPGESFTLSLQIQNIGKQDAKAVAVRISPPDRIVGETISYVGNLKVDDTSTAIFDLEVTPQASPGNVEIPVEILYRDETGKSGRVEKTIQLRVSQPNRSFKSAYLILLGVVAIVIIFILKRRQGEEI